MREISDVIKEERKNINSSKSSKDALEYIRRITMLFKYDLCDTVIIENKDNYDIDRKFKNSVLLSGKRYFLYNDKTTAKKAFLSKVSIGDNKDKFLLVVEQQITNEEYLLLYDCNFSSNENSTSGFTVLGVIVLVLGTVSMIINPPAMFGIFIITIIWSIIFFTIGSFSKRLDSISKKVERLNNK